MAQYYYVTFNVRSNITYAIPILGEVRAEEVALAQAHKWLTDENGPSHLLFNPLRGTLHQKIIDIDTENTRIEKVGSLQIAKELPRIGKPGNVA